MTVIFSTGYTPYTPDSGFLLMETADRLLLETADKILLNFNTVADLPSTHARIAHSGNWHSGGVIDASSTAVGYFAAAPDNTLTYERWKPNTATTQTWAIDFGASVACDYCCIGAHTLGTNGWTLQVQYLEDTVWIDLIPDTAITDDSDIFVIFPLQAFGSWRIRITGGTAPEIGVIKFGRALQMERPIFGGHTPIMMARQTVMKMNESESGEYLGRSKFRTYLQSSFAWRNLTSAWIRENWPLLQRSIETEPFFIAWRPESYSEAAFGRAMASPAPTNSGQRDLMDVELSMRARGYD
jgi:hypothetical protein